MADIITNMVTDVDIMATEKAAVAGMEMVAAIMESTETAAAVAAVITKTEKNAAAGTTKKEKAAATIKTNRQEYHVADPRICIGRTARLI